MGDAHRNGATGVEEPAAGDGVPGIVLPVKGSGPAVVLLPGPISPAAAIRALGDSLGQEGYLVVLAPAVAAPDIAGLVETARAHPAHRGKVGLVAFSGAAVATLAFVATGAADCAVIYGDAASLAGALGGEDRSIPLTLHLAGIAAPADATAKVYAYPDAADGFALPGGTGHDVHLEGLAYSRTVRALKRTMGPHYDLEELWDFHLACEFVDKDAEAAMRTMVPEPYVNHIPTLTGGVGYEMLKRFYKYHFVNQVPRDRRTIPISQTVGTDRIVDEKVFCFTHDCEIDWLLPGVPPTGRYVEIPLVGIVTFRGDKLVNEHIYWDQASVLVQIGLLDPTGLPVAGREQAHKLMDKALPSNEMLPAWAHTMTLPLHD